MYGEDVAKFDGVEYRLWDPFRSKLAAAILRGLSKLPIGPLSKVLYLGAASGTTVSHISDIVGGKGRVYAVEFAQRSFRDLVSNVCSVRPNITPILADARFPRKYSSFISEVGCVYCDIAQPDQTSIFLDNAKLFLDTGGDFLHVVKARSINVAKDPREIFEKEARDIQKENFQVHEVIKLDPFELDHALVRGQRS